MPEIGNQKSESGNRKSETRNPGASFFLISVFCLLTSGAAASGACYSPQAFEADRGLRLHTDLEVIMLTCKYSSRGQSLQPIYAGFVRHHGQLLHRWENVIAATYGGDGVGRNEAIDNFRTFLANQKSNEAATMGPHSFCKQWADFVPYAAALTVPQIMYYVRENDPARPPKKPLCY